MIRQRRRARFLVVEPLEARSLMAVGYPIDFNGPLPKMATMTPRSCT